MFTQILCPIDFTSFSQQAVRQAVAIARCCGATITGIHVIAHDPRPRHLGRRDRSVSNRRRLDKDAGTSAQGSPGIESAVPNSRRRVR